MEDLFVSYEQAVKLKELGFDPFLREDCLAYFNTSNSNNDLETKDWWLLRNNDFQHALSAPLKSQVFKWFRGVHNLSGIPTDESYEIWRLWRLPSGISRQCIIEEYPIASYEEAELYCIDKLINVIQDGTI